MQTGEEVAIKLVRGCSGAWRHQHALVDGLSHGALVHAARVAMRICCPSGLGPFCQRNPQESTRTKHPQLLYESKLYKIMQGGGERSARSSPVGCAVQAD